MCWCEERGIQIILQLEGFGFISSELRLLRGKRKLWGDPRDLYLKGVAGGLGRDFSQEQGGLDK